jgi:hypothetical protein
VSRAHTHLWYDGAWPVATGLVTGLGLVAAYLWTGPLMFLVALAVLELTVAPVAWSLLTDLGFGVRRIALHVAPATATALLAVIGLADVVGGWTFLVVAAAAVTSPLLQGWVQVGIRGVLAGWVSPRAETRRRFDDIVAHGFGTPDEDLPPR